MLDQVRHFLALLVLVFVPPAIVLWYVIHPFARAWRRLGMTLTYLVLFPPAALLAWALYHYRDTLLGPDLGLHLPLVALAVLAAVTAAVVARKRRKYLTQHVLMGGPELSASNKGELLQSGIYARTRNPRYLEFLLFIVAYAAVANYAGAWVVVVLSFPAIHLVVLLEEKELRDRFGAEYDAYCARVPRYLPRRKA